MRTAGGKSGDFYDPKALIRGFFACVKHEWLPTVLDGSHACANNRKNAYDWKRSPVFGEEFVSNTAACRMQESTALKTREMRGIL